MLSPSAPVPYSSLFALLQVDVPRCARTWEPPTPTVHRAMGKRRAHVAQWAHPCGCGAASWVRAKSQSSAAELQPVFHCKCVDTSGPRHRALHPEAGCTAVVWWREDIYRTGERCILGSHSKHEFPPCGTKHWILYTKELQMTLPGSEWGYVLM